MTPALVFLATSTLMTECVFTFAQLGAVVLVHRAVGASSSARSIGLSVCASLAASGAMLTRSAGLAIVVAAFLFMVKERRWKCAGAFAVVAAMCVLPWMVHARAHAPTPAQQDAHRGSIVYGYTDQLWMRWAGAPMSGTISEGDLPAPRRHERVRLFGRSIAGIFVPGIFRGPSESGEEVVALGGAVSFMSASMGSAASTVAISFFLSALVIAGYATGSRADHRRRDSDAGCDGHCPCLAVLDVPFRPPADAVPDAISLTGLQVVTRLTSRLVGSSDNATRGLS